jgi:2-methylcitrate dehydratase PrpD
MKRPFQFDFAAATGHVKMPSAYQNDRFPGRTKMMRTVLDTAVVAVCFAAAAVVRADEPSPNPYAGMTISEALSTLAIETKTDDIPDAAYRAAKTAVLDALGCAFAGHDAPGVPEVVELTHHWGGRPEATVWFHGGKVPGPAAAFANSVQVHALDLDDVHVPSITHITSVIVPTALAMGELNEASGKETLAAVILGIEVAGRLGRACRARTAHEGFLPTSTVGGFGATAAACRLQGCSAQQTTHAMGIWYAHCSGNRQALYDRTLTKRIQPAIAARAGVFASYLAGKDFTGPRRIVGNQSASLTKIYGFRRDAPPPTMDEVMGSRDEYEIELLTFKRYACCGASHMAVESALSLANEHDLKPADIDTISIFGVGVNAGMTGVPWRDSKTPHVLAQFCAPYEVASVIKNRRFGPAEITDQRIAQDREVDALARRTKLCHWTDWGGPRPAQQAVRILLKDGRKLEAWRERDQVLHPDANSYDQLVEKFKYNATFSALVDEEQADKLVRAIENLDKCENIGAFVEQLLVFQESE